MSVAADPRAAAGDLARVATAERDSLGDRSAAITSFQDHERRFGPSIEATDALADLLTEEKRWSDLHDLLAETCRRDRARAAVLAARLGDTCRLRVGDPAHAVDWYESALVADPAQRQPRATGSRRWSRPTAPPCARAPWRRCWPPASRPTTGRCAWDCSIARLADAAAGRPRATILREAAELSETRAQNKATALAHTAHALVADPDDRITEEQLVRLAMRHRGLPRRGARAGGVGGGRRRCRRAGQPSC